MFRTQIYLESRQHKLLIEESHRRRISMAALFREMVERFLTQPKEEERDQLVRQRDALTALIGIGKSGISDVSERHDDYLGDAVEEDFTRGQQPSR